MKKWFVVPLVLSWVALVGCMLLMGGDPWSFIGPSAVAIVILGSLFLLRTHYSFAEMGHAFHCSLRDLEASEEELLVAQEFFGSAQKVLIGTGTLGLVMGVMHVLEGATRTVQPESYPAAAMEGFSVAAITVFYGLLVTYFVIEPFASAVRKKLALLGRASSPPTGGRRQGG